jgi:hypothetical protein
VPGGCRGGYAAEPVGELRQLIARERVADRGPPALGPDKSRLAQIGIT